MGLLCMVLDGASRFLKAILDGWIGFLFECYMVDWLDNLIPIPSAPLLLSFLLLDGLMVFGSLGVGFFPSSLFLFFLLSFVLFLLDVGFFPSSLFPTPPSLSVVDLHGPSMTSMNTQQHPLIFAIKFSKNLK